MKCVVMKMDEFLPYVVDYSGWLIRVRAKNEKSAKYQAWKKFNDAYPVEFIEFARIAKVESDWW